MITAARLADVTDAPSVGALLEQAIAASEGSRGGTLLLRTVSAFPWPGEWPLERRLELQQRWLITGLPRPRVSSPAGEAYLGAGPRFAILAGTLDGEVVGVGLLGCTASPGNSGSGTGQWQAVFYVEPAAREVGVGAALMECANDWVQRISGSRATLDALCLPGDRGTKSFLEGQHMKAAMLTMSGTDRRVQAVVSGENTNSEVEIYSNHLVERESSGPGLQVAVGGVAVVDEALLLVKRGHPPQVGRWSIPGGRVRGNETLQEALWREMFEETGLVVAVGELMGAVERGGQEEAFAILDYRVEVLAGMPARAGDDALEVRWVALDRVAGLDLVEGLAQFLASHGVIPST